VLPANYLGQHGWFLRCAIEEMSKKTAKGKLRDVQCLFLLDEFFSLGYIDEILKAAVLMRGYGLQLWPILQYLGQLQTPMAAKVLTLFSAIPTFIRSLATPIN
jgi:hypothetical protein